MPSTYTSNNKIQKIATGEQSGTWGSTTNTNFDLFDTAIDGFVAVAVTGTTTTLNIPDGSAADGRNKVLSFTGTLSAANTVSVTPNTVKKHYFVQNNTTGSQNIIIYQGSGSTVTVKPGYSSVVYLDGAGGSAAAKEVLTSLKLTALLEATGVVFVGSTSGSTTLQATATASGTLTLPAATDTLVGKATTDTFTNKTLDTAGTGNVLRINGTQVSAVTGTGSVVLATSPTLVTPALGTPTSGTLTSCTGLPISTGVSGLGSGVATFLATPSSSNLAAAVTDETGTGSLVFATSPTIVTPTITTSAVIPLVNGGTAVSSTLTLQSTSGAGSSDAIIFKTASQSERMRILTTGEVGIGTPSPTGKLEVVGGRSFFAAASEPYGVGAKFISTGGSVYFGATNGTGTPDAQISAAGGGALMTLLNGGNVGIGTTSPAQKLTVASGSVKVSKGYSYLFDDANVEIRVDDSPAWLAVANTMTLKTYSGAFVFQNSNGAASIMTVRADTSNVGIGTTVPRTTLSVLQSGTANTTSDTLGPAVFTGPTAGGYAGMLVVESNDAMAANIGGSIGFYGRNTTASTAGSYFSSIHGRKENGTSADQAGYLAFKVRTTGNADNEVVRMASTGNVGIGVTNPAYKLEISTDSAGKPGVGGLWTVVSDERIKTDITPADLDRCYEIVKSVPLKHFGFAPGVYTDDQIQDKHSLGWIAQDVQKVFSKAVSVKPFTLKTEIPDGTEEYTEQDFTLETVEKTETSIQIIDGKPVQVSKVVTSENKVLLFDTVDVVNEAGAVVMDGDKPLTYQMPRMITKTRNKVRHDVIEDCLDLNGGQMIAALYGAVQALMLQVESLKAGN